MTDIKAEYQHPEYLAETHWLERNLDTKDLLIFDCTVYVTQNTDPEHRNKSPFIFQSGRNNYEQAHIPGAGFIDILNDLSDTASEIPLMLCNKDKIIEAMNSYGISNDSYVVLYSTSETNWAARAWWIMRSVGFNNIAILNGGWKKWASEGHPISNQICSYEPGNYVSKTITDAFVDKDEVLGFIDDNQTRIISALPTPIHKGESDICFGRKGRITGSVNVPFMDLHDPTTGCYLQADQLQSKFDDVDVGAAERVITYCGGGIAASNSAFALALLGYDNVSVYDGSMLEWGNDSSLPMEVG